LALVTGYIHVQTVTRLSTNRARRGVTLLMSATQAKSLPKYRYVTQMTDASAQKRKPKTNMEGKYPRKTKHYANCVVREDRIRDRWSENPSAMKCNKIARM